ncbi:MAG: hypothetical protein ACKVOH_07070, partial [Chlamydiales bacterium]
ANTELSYWGYRGLRRHFPRVTFLRFSGENPKRLAQIQPSDVVIGHIGETFAKASERTRRLISFGPWVGHEDHSTSVGPHSTPAHEEMALYNKAISLILLTSEYNQREYVEKARNFWHPYFCQFKGNIRVVHQPIDLNVFRRIKHDYRTNDFLYIGHFGHMKCVGTSEKLVAKLGRTLHLFGSEKRRLDNLDETQVRELPCLADFFIQPGMWEGQCVAILEAAARGFIPVVSPETGYPYHHPFILRYNDFDSNLKTLKQLINTSAEERKELADGLHNRLATDIEHNTWDRLTNVLVEEVQKLY